MILNYREDPTSSAVMTVAILLLAGTLGFMLLAPKPAPVSKAQVIEARDKVDLEARAATKRLTESEAYNSNKLWTGSEQEVNPAVFAMVDKLAKARQINLQALRPQRVFDKVTPKELPYVAVVEGPFTAVLQFAKDLETPQNRVGVSSIMVTSSDASTDKVTVSISIGAFLSPEAPAPAATETKKEKPNA